jgi:nitroimidazol reductase NimA-like FMN-containing flavoprotein (pyridoxamine 5'-phosphate oxidase superfamily)
MRDKVIEILRESSFMAIATNRPDGWPQCTSVGYANEELLIYFVISRTSQKFANIQGDDKVSIAIGRDVHVPSSIRGLSLAARASEVRDDKQRRRAIKLLLERRPALKRLEPPHPDHSAVMRASPEIISVLDYSQGFGHSDLLTVGAGIVQMTAARDDDWGYGAVLKPTV